MKLIRILLMILPISLLLGIYLSFAQTAEELLPKAIQLEEVRGELEEAIEIYLTIVDDHSDNRQIAAKAQLHIGMCYEKLGKQAAQKAYQEVVDSYPEQTEVVKVANEKLSILLRAKEVIKKGEEQYKLSKIYSGLSYPSSMSPDGKKLALLKSD